MARDNANSFNGETIWHCDKEPRGNVIRKIPVETSFWYLQFYKSPDLQGRSRMCLSSRRHHLETLSPAPFLSLSPPYHRNISQPLNQWPENLIKFKKCNSNKTNFKVWSNFLTIITCDKLNKYFKNKMNKFSLSDYWKKLLTVISIVLLLDFHPSNNYIKKDFIHFKYKRLFNTVHFFLILFELKLSWP